MGHSLGFYLKISLSVGNHSLLCGLSSIFHYVVKGIENGPYSAPSFPVNRTGGGGLSQQPRVI